MGDSSEFRVFLFLLPGLSNHPSSLSLDPRRPALSPSSCPRAQSWIYNCETANWRVDLTEYIAWARACKVDPLEALERFLA